VEFLGFAIHAAFLERFDLPLIRLRERNGQPVREQVVARVARGHFHMVGFGPEADDVVR
jgi:hypothetical protein